MANVIRDENGQYKTGYSRAPAAEESPSSEEIAWAAGLLEGDGTIFCTNSNCEAVRIVQANESREPAEVLHRLKRLFGGTIRVGHKRDADNRKGMKGTHGWNICGSRARGFIMTIFPYLSERRREQVKEAATWL